MRRRETGGRFRALTNRGGELGRRFAGKSFLTQSEALIARSIMSKYQTQIAGFDTELALIV